MGLPLLLASLLGPAVSNAQIIDTVAGHAINDNRPALSTPLVRPQGLAFDNNGNLIIADRGQFVIRRIAGGNATVIAGGGEIFDDAIPVPAKSAGLDYPVFMAVGSDGSIYFSDFNIYRVRRITPDGKVTNVAGSGYYGYYGDGGKATLADLSNPTGLALDRTRNLLYIADTYNYVIRRVNLSTGIIDTVAGNGFSGYSGDGGPATLAQLTRPWGLAVDSAGNLYIADEEPVTFTYGLVRKVSLDGTISTFVPTSAGLLTGSKALAFDPAGNLHVADYWTNRVVRVDANGNLITVVGGGSGSAFPEENVLATSTDLVGPSGIVFDAQGNMYISEEGWDIVRRVDAANGLIRTFAGTLDVLDNGPALNAPLSTPHGIAIAGDGTIYVADTFHNRIRKIDAGGVIRTAAGTGEPDSTATAVYYPQAISLDAAENLYFLEPSRSTASWQFAATGELLTLAGVEDQFDYSGDGGDARQAALSGPEGIVSDASGIVYIADTGNHCVRKVDLSYIITRVAGVCTQRGYSGDGGPGLQALLDSPTGLALDAGGNLLISDTGNSVVRRLDLATGIITLVAGIPQEFDYSGDGGDPWDATLGQPAGLAVDPDDGTLYIADEFWSVIRLVRNNRIHTLAGIGLDGFFGDGSEARYAYLNRPKDLAVDPAGNVYVVDTNNNRVRKITLAGLAPPTLSVSPSSLNFRVQQDGMPPPGQFLLILNFGSGFLEWEYDLRIPPDGSGTFTGGQWLFVPDLGGGSAPSLVEVTVEAAAETTPGTHQGQIIIVSPGSNNPRVTIPVTLTVDPPAEPLLLLSTRSMYFDAVQGGAAPASQFLSITNGGSRTLSWEASASTSRGGSWLNISQSSGSTEAGGAAGSLAVSANPAGLAPGFYLGAITVTNQDDGSSRSVEVGLSVGEASGTILTSSSSFVFNVVQGSTSVPAQLLRILNTGQGTMNWQLQSSVSQGNWLRVSPSSGSSSAASPGAAPVVTVAVDPSGLNPGVYGGYLSIQSAGARNTPQLANVLLRVLPAGSPPIAQVLPSGLVFTTTTGSAPQSQQATVQTTGGGTLNYNLGIRTQDGAGWLTASPAAGSLTSSTDRPQVRVQVNPGTLEAGVYRGAVTVAFSNAATSEIAVAMILREPGAISQRSGGKALICVPNQQVILSTGLSAGFSLPTGWPTTLIAAVYDNCGIPVDTSTVAVDFSNGNSSLVLESQGGGIYSRGWVPSAVGGVTGAVQLTFRALNPVLPEASLQLVGALSPDSTIPVVSENGIVNGASFASGRPVSPGSIVSVFGAEMASTGPCFGGNCATSLPLPPSLGGVSVRVAGIEAPLFYAGPGQINAQIPAELSNVTSADVVVSARGVVSAPKTIVLDATQPGIFKASGTQGAVLNQDYSPNSASKPAVRGSVLQIFATGLGPTNPQVPTGQPAPSSPPFAELVTPVTVTIGGVNAPVQFQAQAPGFVGLYQINAQIPASVTPGAAVTLKLTQNGVDSNEVTVAVE